MTKASRHPWLFGTVLVLLMSAALYGCKDFLTNASTPQGTLNDESLQTLAGVEGSLIAAYRSLDHNQGVGGAWGSAASNWVWGSVTSDDAYKGSEASDQPPINDIEAYIWSTPDAESYLNDKWRASYEGVVRTNATLRLLASVRASKPGEISDAAAAGIEGEAKFLRAHYHFEAWRMWLSIPYYTEEDTDFREANSDSATVVANILADLEDAIDLLQPTPRNGQVGRVTEWTAKAYKGRVQMYAGQFAAALTTLRDVEQNGPYELEASFDRVWTGFAEYANGPETILAYQASSNDGEPNGNNANYGERLNFPHSGSPFGCCGFHQPSQNLVNFYFVDATGLPLALSSATWNSRDAEVDAALTAPASGLRLDPRLDWTVGRDGVPYKDWGAHGPTWIRDPNYGGPYSGKKPMHEDASDAESTVGWTPTQLNSVNIHIFRYADLLLLLAEAEIEAGVVDNARQLVNRVRARAGVTAQGPGTSRANMAVPINDPSITWADYEVGQYTVPWANQADARTRVRYERRLELAMEGQRFFDLRRWGTADQVLNAYIAVEENRRPHLMAAQTVVDRHKRYPIPAIQIALSRVGNEERLQQNPGW